MTPETGPDQTRRVAAVRRSPVLAGLVRTMPAPTLFWTPPGILATWGGVGLIRAGSGTWGSAAALPFAALVWGTLPLPWLTLSVATIGVFALGLWASAYVCRSGEADSSVIVIDEVVGQWITFLPVMILGAAVSWPLLLAGFVLFRVFDIWKPGPIGWLDRRVAGAWGVMIDDVAAGALAGAVLLVFVTFA